MSHLHAPTEENDNIMGENNRKEGIEFEQSVSTGINDFTYEKMMNFGVQFNCLSYI